MKSRILVYLQCRNCNTVFTHEFQIVGDFSFESTIEEYRRRNRPTEHAHLCSINPKTYGMSDVQAFQEILPSTVESD